MTRIKNWIIIAILLAFSNVYSQSNNLTGSPYSLFGLGTETNSNIGKNSGMGKSGLTLDMDSEINILNPALFATIPKNRFMYDIGFYAEIDNVSDGKDSELRAAGNFSNISIAFRANEKSGIGLTLMPATNVGYILLGVETEVEGSIQSYLSNINGSGGLNLIGFDYGHSLSKNLNIGFNLSYLFGKIEENEMILLKNSMLKIVKSSYYKGFQAGLGFQLKTNNYNFGLVLDSPVVLNAHKDTNISKKSDSDNLLVDKKLDEPIDDFILPLKVKFGLSTVLNKNIVLSLDYKRSFWGMTDQTDNIGRFTDQDVIGFGTEYTVDKYSYKYWKRISFRTGYNYDTGYLKVDDKRIRNNSFSIGLGLPIDNKNLSFINISYSIGKSGSTEGILIQQNFNTVNLNLSLSDIWFLKRLID